MADFQTEQQRNLDGIRNNASKIGPEFRRQRFYLDNAFDKNDIHGKNVFLSQFKSFWVVDTNNTGFDLNMYINVRGDSGQPLPLKPNMSVSFEYPVNGCAFECTAQAGIWVDIVFAFNTDISVGFVQNSGVVVKSAGFFDDSVQSVTTTAQALIPARSSRTKCFIKNKGLAAMYLGSATMLADAAYKTKAMILNPNDSITWENVSALMVKSESATLTDALYLMDEYN